MASKEQKIDLKKMRNSAEAACRLMKALNHRDRLMLLCEISQGVRGNIGYSSTYVVTAFDWAKNSKIGENTQRG